MIDNYKLGPRIYEDKTAGLQVFEAQASTNLKRFFVKRYSFSSPEEIDSLLKAAVKDAREEHSLEAMIANVVFTNPKDTSRCCIDLVYENLLGKELPWDSIKLNQRTSSSSGLKQYRIGDILHSKKFIGYPLEVRVAESLSSRQEVVIKSMKNVRQLWKGNRILKEAIAQALVAHKYNCGLLDIACIKNDSDSYDLSLVMEKLNHDLEEELKERKDKYTEQQLLDIVYQTTFGLLHAKERVTDTQGFAHRDIKLANIFRASDGCVKVGDFGSVWNQGGSDSVPRRIPSLLSTTEFEEFAQTGDGTLGYLSPEMREMILGGEKVDSYASDIFSLGVCLLELAKLDHTSAARSYRDLSELEQKLEREIELIPYSEWIKFIIRLFLNTNPLQRPSLNLIYHFIIATFFSKNHVWPDECIENMTTSQLEQGMCKIDHLPTMKSPVVSYFMQIHLDIVRASVRLLQSNLDAADRLVQQAYMYQKHVLKIRKFSSTTNCLATLALINFQRKKFDEALRYAGELEYYANDEYYKIPKAWVASLALLAQIHCAREAYCDASVCANLCLENLQTVNSENARSALVAYRVLGIQRMNAGELGLAEQYLLLSLQHIAQYFPINFRLRIQAYSDLAEVYSKAKLLQESLYCAQHALGFINKFCSEDYEIYRDTLEKLRGINDFVLNSFRSNSEARYYLSGVLSNCSIISKFYLRKGKLREAEEILHKALDTPIQYEESSDLADIYHNLSMIEKELGNISAAQRFCLTAKMIYQRYQENYQECALKCTIDLAEIYYSQGNFMECRNMLRECEVELDRKSSVYMQKCNLELNLSVLFGNMDEADQLAQAILELFLESSLFATPQLCNSLAFYYAAKHQVEESEEYSRKALTLLGKNVLRETLLEPIIYCNLAAILLQLGKLRESEEFAGRCLGLLVSAGREHHPCFASALLCLSLQYRDLGEREKSWEEAVKCIEYKGQENIEFYPDVLIFLQYLPSLPLVPSEIPSDSPRFPSYANLRSRLLSEQNTWGVWNSVIVSFILLQFGKGSAAAYLLSESPAANSSIFPASSLINAALWHNYACGLLDLQQYDDALKSAEASLSAYGEMENSGGETGSYYLLAVIHHLTGELTEAAYFAEKYANAVATPSRSVRETLASIFKAARENERAGDLRQKSFL